MKVDARPASPRPPDPVPAAEAEIAVILGRWLVSVILAFVFFLGGIGLLCILGWIDTVVRWAIGGAP